MSSDKPLEGEGLSDYLERQCGRLGTQQRRLAMPCVVEHYARLWAAYRKQPKETAVIPSQDLATVMYDAIDCQMVELFKHLVKAADKSLFKITTESLDDKLESHRLEYDGYDITDSWLRSSDQEDDGPGDYAEWLKIIGIDDQPVA